MLVLIENHQRGKTDLGWLQSQHSFSFGQYHNQEQMRFGPLLAINEDIVQPAKGFATHPHQDMEIISYVLSGALEHKDSMGNGSIISAGNVQRMSAGTGVRHSEFNHSTAENVHFIQIWIEPKVKGITPDYEEKYFDAASKHGSLRLIVSADGRDGSILIHQDVSIYDAILNVSDVIKYALVPHHTAYIHVIRGSLEVNEIKLNTGDALKITQESSLEFKQADAVEFLLFDLPY